MVIVSSVHFFSQVPVPKYPSNPATDKHTQTHTHTHTQTHTHTHHTQTHTHTHISNTHTNTHTNTHALSALPVRLASTGWMALAVCKCYDWSYMGCLFCHSCLH